MGRKRQPVCGAIAISGTTESPMPAATIARMVSNWALSKATLSCSRARRQAVSVTGNAAVSAGCRLPAPYAGV